ncbi:phage scaffolding protein [Asaia sp. BMEF1]|uniref:phage scaffolding protein n=1 Tax=Asaia sp. BMEF1 TaxID=3155932 RepID=UPI003F66A4D8
MSDDIDALRRSLAELAAERDSLVQAHQEEMVRVTQAARETVLTNALRAEAVRLGAHDPDAVMALMDRSGIGWSEQGEISGVEEAMAQARRARGFLFQDPRSTVASVGRESVVPRPAAEQMQDARALTKADYVARKRQFLAGII